MNRVAFLIDGFNVYHSAVSASRDLVGATTKWLNLRALCESYLYLVGGDAQIVSVHYFSALATHLQDVKPDVIKRHLTLIECLRATGVTVELGRFKQKTVHCDACRRQIIRHEEKETDVAIAVRLLELFVRSTCDTAVIVTGDTDVAPAVRCLQQLFPAARVLFAFPYGRKNQELAKLAPGSFSLRKEQYAKFQFPDPFVTPNGRKIYKPAKW